VFEGAVYRNIAVFGRKSSSEGKRKELMKIFGSNVEEKFVFFFEIFKYARGQNWKTH